MQFNDHDKVAWGYYVHREGRAGLLEVWITAAPAKRHFSPKQVRLGIAASSGNVETLAITHPWTRQGRYRARAGRVILRAHTDEVAEVFTFGGELDITSNLEMTTCTLTSPVPIIEVSADDSMLTMLVAEVEVLLARRRAVWGEQEYAFEKRLASADPLVLYTTCLATLRDHVAHIPESAQEDLFDDLEWHINAELRSIQADGHDLGETTLEDLL